MARGKTLDQKGMGREPTWTPDTQPSDENRRTTKIQAFSWFNYFHNAKDAKVMIHLFLTKDGRKDDAKLIKKVSDNSINKSFAWLMQLSLNGLELRKTEREKIEVEISRLKHLGKKSIKEKAKKEENKPKKPNVQEIMKARAMLVGGDLEALLDDYIELGVPSKHKIKPIGTLMTSTMLPQHVPLLIEPWEDKIAEFKELQLGEDKQLVEAYSNFGKIQVRHIIGFCELVIHDLHSYVTYKKSTRARPKKKTVPVAKVVSKLKYLKEFNDLDLKSLPPVKIPESKEMFVYDTKKRKLHYYKADDLSGGLSVKNSTIVGFSVSETCAKTLRKPIEQLKEFNNASKPNSRKFFSDIKAVETKLSGRFNEHIVILKIFN